MKSTFRILAGLIALILLMSCDAVSPTPGTSPLDSPLTKPLAPAEPKQVTLTDSSLGGVTGRFILQSTGQPTGGFAIYLGEQLPLEPGPAYAVTVQQNSSPKAVTDADGRFAFADVKPGTYALVLWTPFNSVVVPDPNDPAKELQVVITAGQVTQIGDVVANMP